MPGSTSRGYPYPLETDAPPDVASDVQSLAEAVDADVADVADAVVPLDVVGTNISTSHPGDTKAAGTSGLAADAAHRHAREAEPADVPLSTFTTKVDLLAATGADAVARVPAGANNTIPVSDSAAGPGISFKTLAALLQLLQTTKGDLAVSNGSTV